MYTYRYIHMFLNGYTTYQLNIFPPREVYEVSWKIAFALYIYDSTKTPKENGISQTAVLKQEDTKEDILFFNFETEKVKPYQTQTLGVKICCEIMSHKKYVRYFQKY